MGEQFYSVNLDEDRMLIIAPLTDQSISACGDEIDDPSGYFLYEKRRSDPLERVEILAHVQGEEAAFRLRKMLNME